MNDRWVWHHWSHGGSWGSGGFNQRFDQSDGSISPLDRKCKGFEINAGYNWVHGRARAFPKVPFRILVQTYQVSRLQNIDANIEQRLDQTNGNWYQSSALKDKQNKVENWNQNLKLETIGNWNQNSKLEKIGNWIQNQEILKDLVLENWNGNPQFTRKYEIWMFESFKLSNNTCYLSLFQSTSNFGF